LRGSSPLKSLPEEKAEKENISITASEKKREAAGKNQQIRRNGEGATIVKGISYHKLMLPKCI